MDKSEELDSCDFLVEDLDFDEDGGSAAQTDLPPPLVDFDEHRSGGVCQLLYVIYLPFSRHEIIISALFLLWYHINFKVYV